MALVHYGVGLFCPSVAQKRRDTILNHPFNIEYICMTLYARIGVLCKGQSYICSSYFRVKFNTLVLSLIRG